MTYQIGFFGFGNMAQAICRGILNSQYSHKKNIAFTQRDPHKAASNALEFGITHLDLDVLLSHCDLLILGVKPQQLEDVADSLALFSGQSLVSLLAGTSISTLSDILPSSVFICRSMPNTPALIGQGLTGLSFSPSCDTATKQKIESLFNSVGKSLVIEESGMDALTAVSGSGPAFIYKIAEEIAQTAAKNNLDYAHGIQAIAQSFIGAGHMLLESKKTTQTLIQNVRSPNGTTAAGLERLEHSPFSEHLAAIIQAAINKSKELGAS